MRPRKRKTRKLTKSEQMARVRNKDTEPEALLRKALWGAGIRYRLRLPLPGTPDIAFPQARLAVFVDGCFWHGCPKHYTGPNNNADFWRRKLERNIIRDHYADEKLAELGWAVLRIWEHEVHAELKEIVDKIKRLLQLRRYLE